MFGACWLVFLGAPKLTWEPQKPCKTLGFLQFYYKTMGSYFSFGAGGGRFIGGTRSYCVFALHSPHVRISYYLHIFGRSGGSLGGPRSPPEGPQNLLKNFVWSLLACFFGAPKLAWGLQKPCKTLGFLQFYYKTARRPGHTSET